MSATPPNERELFLQAMALPAGERQAFVDKACGAHDGLRTRLRDLLNESANVGSFLEGPALAEVPRRPTPGLNPETKIVTGLTEMAGDRIGRYKLLQNIGEGGCGVVYMAEQEEPVRRRVALKIIKPGMDTKSVIARFEAERQALALMEHPNIAKFFDAGTTGGGTRPAEPAPTAADAAPVSPRPTPTPGEARPPTSEYSRPFFVMELVRGVRITDYCDQNNLPTASRLELFIQVCQAIHHAHQKGIIHRDIKPSNILVTLHDGRPVPKVIDFGIAKATEQRLTAQTLFTQFSAFIGTPAYMSPEQAEMSSLDVDTRSDIYSLGVLLYELLTGRTPFDAETLLRSGLDECRRTIREIEPLRPSTRLASMAGPDLTTAAAHRRVESTRLIHQLQGDLDWVVMKCLEKDRTRRYASANDLALDIGRYLRTEPVEARPPSNLYRLGKLVRRHRAAFSAAAAIAGILVASAALSAWLAIRATRAEHQARGAQAAEAVLRQQAETERARAERERELARLNEYVADINLAQQSLAGSSGNLPRAVQLLAKHQPKPGETDLRGFEWRYLWQQCQGDEHIALPGQPSPVQSLAFDPHARWLAVGLQTNLNIYDLTSRRLITNLAKGALWLTASPDGRTLFAASPSTVRAWDTARWAEVRALPNNTGPITLSSNGTRLLTFGRNGGVTLWDTGTWQALHTNPDAVPPMALSPDGRWIVTDAEAGLTVSSVADERPPVVLADSTNVFFRGGSFGTRAQPRGRADEFPPGLLRSFARPPGAIEQSMAFSRDGQFVVAPRNSLSEWGVFVLGIWDASTGRQTVMPDDPEHVEHTGSIAALAFSPDGRYLATASADYSLRLWNFQERQRTVTFSGHGDEVHAAAFSPDGAWLASGARDGTVYLWPIRPAPVDDVIPGTWQPLAFSRDSRRLAALNKDRALVFLNLATGEADQQFPLEREGSDNRGRPRFGFGNHPVALTPDFRTIAFAPGGEHLQVIDTQTYETNLLRSPDPFTEALLMTTDGRTLVTAGGRNPSRGREVRVWDLTAETNVTLATDASRVLLAPDNQSLAIVTRSNQVQLWNLPARSLRLTLPTSGDVGGLSPGAFSSDSRRLALIGQDETIRILDLAEGRLLGICAGHKQRIWSVAFAPDGKTLASVSDDSTLKLWNVATQQELLTIRRLGGSVRELLFSPDGRMLIGSRGLFSRFGGLRFYRAPDFEAITRATAAKAAAAPLE